jgi:UDP-N-acetylmuramate dehydrogenase
MYTDNKEILPEILVDMDNRGHTSGIRGIVKTDEPMSRHTSWRAGGMAKIYFEPVDEADLINYLARIPADEPVLCIGLGSNLLIRDGGYNGTVITLTGILNRLELPGENRIRVEAGVPCAKLARFSAQSGLTGAEFMAGIPGTMGGALAMNAGAFGHETWDIVTAVKMLDRSGHCKLRVRSEFEIGYRQVDIPGDEWFIAAELQLQPDIHSCAQQRIRELLARRSETQPVRQLNCGSVFRNPPGDYAARLIESSGLKGMRLGGASVSEKHANFIINHGGATAQDIERLILHIQETVRRQHGIELVPEVRIVGDV